MVVDYTDGYPAEGEDQPVLPATAGPAQKRKHSPCTMSKEKHPEQAQIRNTTAKRTRVSTAGEFN